MAVDVHPFARQHIGDPNTPIFITEGVRKADAAVSVCLCCVALLGVWNWRGTNEHQGKTVLPDWESIALNGREVYLAFDSDVTEKREVRLALRRLKAFLESRKARVKVIHLPAGDGGEKVGLDDFLAAGHTTKELFALASESALGAGQQNDRQVTYQKSPSGLTYLKQTREGTVPVALTNFTAEIVRDITEDDGVETRRSFEIEASLGGRTHRFTLPAHRFGGMGWAVDELGASGLIYPGSAIRDHARAAIQVLSEQPETLRRFTHLGWRQIEGSYLYLHAGGAIGPDGHRSDVVVAPPEALSCYVLPGPPDQEQLVEAIRASASILDLAPPEVSFPLLASVYCAPLGGVGFSVFVAGPTGEGKTALSAVALQHYGAGLDAEHLPCSWASTGNALETIAFSAKDALLLVDDFVPRGTQYDVQRQHREAERLFRAQGNSSGRQRLRADATLRSTKWPRGLILSTGEDIPRGQSLRARLLVLELSPGDLDWKGLTLVQRHASDATLAQAFGGYLKWLAPRYEALRSRRPRQVREFRDHAFRGGQHMRTAFMTADLALGLHYFLSFAWESGAFTARQCSALWRSGWTALMKAADTQGSFHEGSEPTRRFIELLHAAIVSGYAHVSGASGGHPENPEAWGWRLGGDSVLSQYWRPQGSRIGWLDSEGLYLEPEAAFAAAQRMARDGGDPLPLGSKTLHKRLNEKGLLRSRDTSRNTLTVRRTLGGARRSVLHLRAASLLPKETDQTDQPPVDRPPDHDVPWSVSWSVPWMESDHGEQETDHELQRDPEGPSEQNLENSGSGQFGQVSREEGELGSSRGGDAREITIL